MVAVLVSDCGGDLCSCMAMVVLFVVKVVMIIRCGGLGGGGYGGGGYRVGSLGCDGGCAGDLGGGLHSDGGHDEGPGGGGCCNIGWSWSLSSRKKEMEEKTHTLLAYHRYHMAFFTKL